MSLRSEARREDANAAASDSSSMRRSLEAIASFAAFSSAVSFRVASSSSALAAAAPRGPAGRQDAPPATRA